MDDRVANGLGDLYRSAVSLGKGSISMGRKFLREAEGQIGERLLVKESDLKLDSKEEQLYWAEKVLDEYYRLKFSRCV